MAIIIGTPVIGTSGTTSFTCGSSSNVVVVTIAASFASGNSEDVTVTYNSVSMAKLSATRQGDGSCFIFHLNSPTTGAHNLVVTPVSSSIGTIRVAIMEIQNSSSSQPGATLGSLLAVAPISKDLVTTGQNGVVFDVWIASPTDSYTIGAGQTQLFNATGLGQSGDDVFLSSYESYITSGTVTMSWVGNDMISATFLLVELKGIIPTVRTLTATYASYIITAFDTFLRTYNIKNTNKPSTSFTNISKPTTPFTNVSKPSTTITNVAKPNV